MPDYKSKTAVAARAVARKGAQAKTSVKPGKGRARAAGNEDDDIYGEVDKFHGMHQRDSMKGHGLHMVGDSDSGSDDEEELDNVEPVMGLGMGSDEDDDDDDLDEDDDEDEGDDDDNSENEARAAAIKKEDAILAGWGKKRSAYHGGDADVEIDEEAAAAEEEEALRLQRKRAESLDEDDFAFGYSALGSASSSSAADASGKKSKGSKASAKKAPAAAASAKKGKALLAGSDDEQDDEDGDDSDGGEHSIAAAIKGKKAPASGASAAAAAASSSSGSGRASSGASAKDLALVAQLDAAMAALDGSSSAAASSGPAGAPAGDRRKASKASAAGASGGVEVVAKQLGSLSRAEKLDIVLSDTPELLGLLSELREKAAEVRGTLAPVLAAVAEGRLGASAAKGLSFLEVKAQLLLAYVADLTFYMLLKAEGKPVRDHPVIAQLVEIRALLEKMRPLDARLAPTLAKLLQAAATAPAKGAHSDEEDEEEGSDAGGDGVDFSDVKGHPALAAKTARASAHKASAAAAAVGGGAGARPNLAALLTHGSEKPALAAAAAGAKKRSSAGKKAAAGSDDEEGASEGEGGFLSELQPHEAGAYKPLRRSAVAYDDAPGAAKAAREEARRASRLSRSALLSEMRAAYTDAPEEDGADGVGVRGSAGAGSAGVESRLDRIAEERRAFEEDAYARVGVSKAEKKERKARAKEAGRWDAMGGLQSFGDVEALLEGGGGGSDEEAEGLGGDAKRAGASASALAAARARTAGSLGGASALPLGSKTLKSKRKQASRDDGDDEGDDGMGGFGGAFKGDSDDDGGYAGSKRRRGGGGDDGGSDGGGEDDPFYSAVEAAARSKKARKAAAKEGAAAETRQYIRMRPDGDALKEGANGHRKASRTILNNRGLVKYRKREDKNPRVAYRLKAAKAEKRRSGAVVKMRGPGEGVAYGGEATGIRAGVTKARKIRS